MPNDTPMDQQHINGEVQFGTPLWRLQDTINNQPLDQESTDFYAGDIRDVCNAANGPDALKKLVKGKSPGESVNLKISDVRALVASALKPVAPEAV